jgi:nucleotide-binding universal stress UspA family protein
MDIAKRIQLVVDRSANSKNAADQAVKMAKELNAELSSLYVVNTHMHKTPNVIKAMVRTGKKQLMTIKETASNMKININTSTVLVGGPTNDILKETKLNQADLLIIGAGENSPKGSVPGKLIRKAKCNLLLVRSDPPIGDFSKILVLTNDIKLERAPLFAANIAKRYNAELTACYVVDVEQAMIRERIVYLQEASNCNIARMPHRTLGEKVTISPILLDKLNRDQTNEGYRIIDTVAGIAKDAGVDVNPVILKGKPAEEVIGYAEEGDFDLIVMEHTSRSKVSQLLLGSIPEKVARNASCSVMIVNRAS